MARFPQRWNQWCAEEFVQKLWQCWGFRTVVHFWVCVSSVDCWIKIWGMWYNHFWVWVQIKIKCAHVRINIKGMWYNRYVYVWYNNHVWVCASVIKLLPCRLRFGFRVTLILVWFGLNLDLVWFGQFSLVWFCENHISLGAPPWLSAFSLPPSQPRSYLGSYLAPISLIISRKQSPGCCSASNADCL